ncbi:MAG: histidine kinase dimerization/phospho-acceptor domain-containing protein, partial [Syntrophus sp. (in: bacteria)]
TAQTGYKRVARDELQVELDGFTTRFETIGDDIIYNVTSGKMRKEHVDVFFQLYRKVLNAMKLPGGHYFRIVNWEDLQGTTWEARQHYTEGTNSLGRDFPCAMSVGFGLNGVMKAIVNVSRPFVAFPIVVEDNFERALGAIEKKKKEMGAQAGRVRGSGKAAEENRLTASAYPVTRFDNMQDRPSEEAGWELELDGISCNWQLIGDDTLLYTVRGNMKAHHVKELFELYERVINESGLAKKGYLYQIADWGDMGPGTQRSRKLYIERFRQLNRMYPVRLYVIFGLSRVLRTVIALMGQFFPVRIMVAKSLEEAVSIIAKQRVTKAATAIDKEEKTPGLSGGDEQQSIEKLLKFMGEINWDLEGTDAKEQNIPLSHPFRPLFEAVALIKEDFDLLLREKDNAERIIAEQNKFNRLRAEIWKTAAQKSIGEDELIQQLLDEIGPVFNVSRACFLRLKNDDEASDLTCDIEWCNAGIKPTKGNKEPGFLIKHFVDKDLINITQQSALEMIPGPLRVIARPVLATMAAIEDLESTSLLAYRVDGKTRGWFSFDVCRSQKDTPKMTEEMGKIAAEVVSIVSNNVAQKRAEEQVVEAYVGMEHAVLERTVELKSSQELAEKANRAKGDFLTNMSHEIRTPLNGIMGFAQIIARSKDVNPRERKQAEQITAECGKLLELINQLLDLAKIEAGKMGIDSQNFSLQALIGDIISA